MGTENKRIKVIKMDYLSIDLILNSLNFLHV